MHTWGRGSYDYCYGSCSDNQGNVYAVGYTRDPVSPYDYGAMIVKFSAGGDLKGAAKWGNTSYTDYCYGAVACDSNGNVFMNVRSYDSAGPAARTMRW